MLGHVHTKRHGQCCDNSAMTLWILFSTHFKATPLFSMRTDFLASLSQLTLTLGVNWPLVGLQGFLRLSTDCSVIYSFQYGLTLISNPKCNKRNYFKPTANGKLLIKNVNEEITRKDTDTKITYYLFSE